MTSPAAIAAGLSEEERALLAKGPNLRMFVRDGDERQLLNPALSDYPAIKKLELFGLVKAGERRETTHWRTGSGEVFSWSITPLGRAVAALLDPTP